MTHSHSHHNHEPYSHAPENKTVLAMSFSIIVIYMFVEFVSGYYFNSLTLMADAGHMANDSFSLLLALIALFLTVQKQKYFALLNGLSLILVAIMILWEAFERFGKPTEMLALPMLSADESPNDFYQNH